MMKVGFIVVVAMLTVAIVSAGEISTDENVSPAPSPVEHYSYPPRSETGMSPSPSPLHSESKPPTTMPSDLIYPPTSQPPEAGDIDHNDVSGTEGESSSGGGKKAGIAVGAIAAASMVGVGGYVLKKRRENIRRSRYEYAASEIL